MTEKVKLTQEQANAIETMRRKHYLAKDKEALIHKHVMRGWGAPYTSINKIPILDFTKLVLNDFDYDLESGSKEVALWKSFGREVGWFKDGDVVVAEETVWQVGEEAALDDELFDASKWYSEGRITGIYPTESFISLEKKEG